MPERDIACVFHGRYGVPVEQIPCCPICDQPMCKGEPLQLEYCDAGRLGEPDLVRLVHYECANEDEDGDQ